ncbi:E3 ubiquitin-protein ligase RNF26-like [Hyla sarda]|uniref:E3 ubiquitin-protein ligase RNF26-like n=1 Tax=Hyla sarda TaxID=327740 RepID=UPI0024C212EE|nr:E3 ubiquitin-protein ligase RNF26-like [Hyla sarda]XP_056409684.1 E3 ubiquitin-protein ligase RNF26-like [Hyla sarda]
MQGILLLISGLGWTLDLLLLVLDLNYWLVSSLLTFLFRAIHFILNLPGTITFGLLRCWENALVSMALLGETCGNLALASMHAVGDGVRGLLSGLDSLQLVWNLMCHVLLRSKEMMQRGLLNMALSGQNFQLQVWEALGIASSLVAYVVNSLVNVCLIGVQNVFSAVLGLWFTLVNVIFVGKDLIAALLSQMSSSAVAVVILFWTPFQLAVDLLVSCSTGIGVILFRHLYEVALLLLLLWFCRMILRPSPALRSFQERLHRLGHFIQILIRHSLNAELWRRVAAWCLQHVRMYRAAWDRDHNLLRTRQQNAPVRVVRAQSTAGTTRVHNLPRAQGQHAPAQNVLPEPIRVPQSVSPVPLPYASTSHETETAAEDPWKLLKQQEESKKCVICQDENKTVLLLPCRHLCLCSQCSEILLQQPILQRNCPLCRKMILQTLTVYM